MCCATGSNGVQDAMATPVHENSLGLIGWSRMRRMHFWEVLVVFHNKIFCCRRSRETKPRWQDRRAPCSNIKIFSMPWVLWSLSTLVSGYWIPMMRCPTAAFNLALGLLSWSWSWWWLDLHFGDQSVKYRGPSQEMLLWAWYGVIHWQSITIRKRCNFKNK